MADPGATSPGGEDPFQSLFGGTDLGSALRRIGDLLSGSEGPVNWKLARESALQAVANEPPVIDSDTAAVREAVSLADLWLDPVTTMPSGVASAQAWSRRRWIEVTLPTWTELVEPVAARVGAAMGGALPEEMRGVAGPLLGVLQQMGALMFGGQVGQALGQLAGEVVGATDVGLPLGPAGQAALLPGNIRTFGEGLGLPDDEVRLYLALREAAHHRLFGHVPWLRSHLFDSVGAYARGITIDTGALESALRDVDPTDPESMQRALGGGMFEPQTTPEQQAALRRLETALALVEGWVDHVVGTAAGAHLPAAAALRETVRRRRATGGPAEQTFAALVGLELRPRRLRDAATLWAALEDRRGLAARDRPWSHPDLLPGPDDLDDPLGFATRGTDAELDLGELEDGDEGGGGAG